MTTPMKSEEQPQQYVQVYQLGGPGTLMSSRRFLHTSCVTFPYRNYKKIEVTEADWQRYLIVMPIVDAAELQCVMCNQPLIKKEER
jgi:hypothetical protein